MFKPLNGNLKKGGGHMATTYNSQTNINKLKNKIYETGDKLKLILTRLRYLSFTDFTDQILIIVNDCFRVGQEYGYVKFLLRSTQRSHLKTY